MKSTSGCHQSTRGRRENQLGAELSPQPHARQGVVSRLGSCVACGGEVRPLFHLGEYTIAGCGDCGMGLTVGVCLPERFYADMYFERAADYGAAGRAGLVQPGADGDAVDLVELVERARGTRGGSALDIGSGAGRQLKAFLNAGWLAKGVEPSKSMADLVREHLRCEIFCGRFEDFPVSGERFDAVTALHVLEHMTDPLAFARKCADLLSPGGILVVEVPDFGCRSARRAGAAWKPLYPDTHAYHFTRSALATLLANVGLGVVRWSKYGGVGEHVSSSGSASAAPHRVFAYLFSRRALLYRIPRMKKVLRYFYWGVLGHGEYLRCLAAKM